MYQYSQRKKENHLGNLPIDTSPPNLILIGLIVVSIPILIWGMKGD